MHRLQNARLAHGKVGMFDVIPVWLCNVVANIINFAQHNCWCTTTFLHIFIKSVLLFRQKFVSYV